MHQEITGTFHKCWIDCIELNKRLTLTPNLSSKTLVLALRPICVLTNFGLP